MKFLILPKQIFIYTADCMGYCPVDCWRFGPCQKKS